MSKTLVGEEPTCTNDALGIVGHSKVATNYKDPSTSTILYYGMCSPWFKFEARRLEKEEKNMHHLHRIADESAAFALGV